MSTRRAIGPADRSDEGRGRQALVTGASSGIGRAVSQLLAAKGYDVIVVARRRERLEALKAELESAWGVTVTPYVADLSDETAVSELAAQLRGGSHRVDVLVNNAGYAQLGRFADLDWQDQLARTRVMCLAVLELTHAALPQMVDRRWGRVINVTSIAGTFSGSPQDVLYSATKSMVIKFTEGLAVEYADHGIHCTASIPGFTATEIFEQSGFAEYIDARRWMRAAMMQPETVARQAYAAVESQRIWVIHGWHHKAMAGVMLHSPVAVRRRLASLISGHVVADAG